MKKAMLLPCFLLGGLSLMAQSQHHPFSLKKSNEKHRKFINHLLESQVQVSGTAQKPTATQQRVIAQAYIDDNSMPSDSFAYKYSGTHGSRFDANNLTFGYNQNFQSDYLPLSNFSMVSPLSMNLLADSINYYEQDTLSNIQKAFYRSDNKVDSFYSIDMSSTPNIDIEKTIHHFNSQGFLNTITLLDNYNNYPSFDAESQQNFSYNTAQTKLINDTTFDISGGTSDFSGTNKYHYNAQNNIDSITYSLFDGTSVTPYQLSHIEYTTDNKIQKVTTFYYSADTVAITIKDSFAYAGNQPYFTLYDEYYYGGFDSSGNRIIRTIGTNGMPDSAQTYYTESGAWTEDTYIKYSYNSYNNPTKIVAHVNEDSSFAGQINFYYETYDDGVSPPASINDIKGNKDFSIYPNPFDNKINIQWKGAKANQTKISLVNVLGQTVYNAAQNLNIGTNTLDIPNLTKGNYILLIQDEKGNIWKSQLVKN